PGPLAEGPAVVDVVPRLAAVVGAEQAALVGLDHGVDAPAVGGGDGQLDLAPGAGRQPLAALAAGALRDVLGDELRPGVAAVARGVQAAARPAAGQLPRFAARLPEPGEKHLRRRGVHRDVAGAGVLILVEDLLPGLAAIGGAVDAALLAWAEGVAQDGRVGDVGV